MNNPQGPKVVLDTNSLLVSIGRLSPYRPIFDAIIQGKTRLLYQCRLVNRP